MSSETGIAQVMARRLGLTGRRSVNQLIFQAIVSIASATLLLRVMGLFSQIAITSHFGAGAVMDAYFVASGLPLSIAALVVGTIEVSIIPVYAQVRSQGSALVKTAVFSTVFNVVLIGAVLLTVVILVFRRQVIYLTAPALDPYRISVAIQLAPVIFPAMVLTVMAGCLERVLNAEGQFSWPAYAGVLIPMATALLVLEAGDRLGVAAIAVGTLVGIGLQLVVLIYRLRRAQVYYRPILDWSCPEVGLVFMAMWPALLGSMVIQVGPVVDQIFASFLSAGSISALNYAGKISSLPVGLVFVAVGRAALPYLAHQAAARDMRSFKNTLRLYLWVVGLVTAGLTICMIGLAHPLVRILFQRGAFSSEDTNRTAITLAGFAIGLVPMGLGFLLVRAFSALGKNHILMWITFFSVIANAAFDYVMARYWQSAGIALATSAVYCCTLVILLVLLRRSIGDLDILTPPPELARLARKVVTREYYLSLFGWQDETNER